MPKDLILTTPATVEVHVPGHGRVRVRFDRGPVPDPDGTVEVAAVEHLRAVLARRGDGPGEVPETVADVKAWVADDPDRAAAALTVERGRPDGPRTTLEPWLAGLAGPDDDHDAGATGDDQES